MNIGANPILNQSARRVLSIIVFVSIIETLALSYVQLLRFDISGIRTVFDLTYVDGKLIRNIAEHGRYRVCGTQVVNEWGSMCFSAHRLPLIPVVAAAMVVLVTPKIAFLLVVKNALAVVSVNCILFLPILCSNIPVGRKALALAPVVLVLGSPIVINTLGQLEYEEAYALPLFVAAYALLESFILNDRPTARTAIMCACLVLLSLTKSTYFLVDLALAGLWLFRERAKPLIALFPLGFLMLALLGWGAFSYHESGRFAFGSAMSYFNGANLYKGNNPYTASVYPYYLDTLDREGLLKPDEPVHDEWELNAYYVRKTKEFVEDNPGAGLQLLARKIKTLFLSYEANGTRRNLIPNVEWCFLPAKLVLQVAICAALWSAIRVRRYRRSSIVFLAVVGAYSLPLIVGFGYDRHVVLPGVVAAVFLCHFIARYQGAGTERRIAAPQSSGEHEMSQGSNTPAPCSTPKDQN